MNDVKDFMGDPNKTVLRTTPSVPTFTVKTVDKLVAKIDYWDYEDTRGKTFDDIINIVKKSTDLPIYNKIIGDCNKRVITLYRKETIVVK